MLVPARAFLSFRSVCRVPGILSSKETLAQVKVFSSSVSNMSTKEERLRDFVLANSEKGSPESVLSAVDKFCWTDGQWMMHVGDQKGITLDAEVKKAAPKSVLEVGRYCGYSATRIARLLPEGGKLVSVDPVEATTAIARQLLDQAGLLNRVDIRVGTIEAVAPELKGRTFDLVFIDHEKTLYLEDLKRIEAAGLLHSGSVLVTDNVLLFQLDDYLEHLRESGLYSSVELHRGNVEYDKERVDGVAVAVFK